MEPFPGLIDLSKTALIIIDMQVRTDSSGISHKEEKGRPTTIRLFELLVGSRQIVPCSIDSLLFVARFLGARRFW
jgi:hypothetical protein